MLNRKNINKQKSIRNSRGGYLLSLILNGIFILLFACALIYKRDAVVRRWERLFAVRAPSDGVLATFNNEPLEAFNGIVETAGADGEISVLFLGNSITLHQPIEEDLVKAHKGMMATKLENDYVHLVCAHLARDFGKNVNFSVVNISRLERHFTEFPFDEMWLENASVRSPDWLVVQIGENVRADEIRSNGELFSLRYAELLRKFPSAEKIACLPFWPDAEKNAAITRAALDTGSYIVDLSHLGSGIDERNFASSERDYKMPGVGAHPGDFGMKNIADCVYNVMKARGN